MDTLIRAQPGDIVVDVAVVQSFSYKELSSNPIRWAASSKARKCRDGSDRIRSDNA